MAFLPEMCMALCQITTAGYGSLGPSLLCITCMAKRDHQDGRDSPFAWFTIETRMNLKKNHLAGGPIAVRRHTNLTEGLEIHMAVTFAIYACISGLAINCDYTARYTERLHWRCRDWPISIVNLASEMRRTFDAVRRRTDMNKPAKYVADCRHVKEVSLYGNADLGFWSQKLAKEGLVPLENNGKAQIIIIGGNMKYGGIEFTEVSFSVFIEPPSRQENQSVFLVQAFNSSRLFSFCERAFFSDRKSVV